MADSVGTEQNAGPARPRLNLKPRDPQAAAKLEAERQRSLGAKNPFGEAKPREAIIASRVGKSEEEILKEEVAKEKLHLRLTGEQLEEKRVAEAAVKEVEDEIAAEEDTGKRALLAVELKNRQLKLDTLMEKFEKMAIEAAHSGAGPRVSEMRARQQAAGGDAGLVAGAPGRYNPTQQYAGDGGRGEGGYQQRGGYSGGGRGFDNYNQGGDFGGRRGGRSGGFRDNYHQAEDRPQRSYSGGQSGGYGDGGYNRNYQPRGGRQQLPEWALEDAGDQGFYDVPSMGGNGGSGYRGGRGRGGGRNSGGYRSGGRGYGDGGYSAFAGGSGSFDAPAGRGIGGEIDYEGFGSQDRF